MTDIITLGSITLPGDLRWVDEFTWSPVVREQEYSLTGALIIQEATRQVGRPITLEAQSEEIGFVWLLRSTVTALYNLAATSGWSGLLTLTDGRSFTVAFREDGISAEPVQHRAPSANSDPYTLTLKLQTVA